MQIIKYKFADGTTNEVSVTEEFYLLYLQLVQMEKRNIHFYINKCGFSAVEFICENHAGTSDKTADGKGPGEGPDEMFRFEKVMR